ncbi:unnamed protein product [Didymodactylos carnosus]|uniref:Uncharacterized protein n=1 Tax=Didymodactylos carnosus TaxID=1234261 RepID=A0A814V480_9BILA|nr:unnamed protein product [Didymodactylos carnosus]CAF1181721.1 unnamed protein product [Didymodactylos carnosus]CAF3559934.1 unnamed protein product [Didymodactylos carnosus]CAF3946081.1 unnamed protein product [Didymodactylos carnosus]
MKKIKADILIHAWVDYGLDSKKGKASFKHLNSIHDTFASRTRNYDFIFVLCCFIVDTIQIIEIFEWRNLNDKEKQAIFLFYKNVGERMRLVNCPNSIEEVYSIVHKYTESELDSKLTVSRDVFTDAITKLVEKWYSRLIPPLITRSLVNAILYIVGGETFHQKLGLKKPSVVPLYTVYSLAVIRKCLMQFMPPRTTPHCLSNILMKNIYHCPATNSSFSSVGPPEVIAHIVKDKKGE